MIYPTNTSRLAAKSKPYIYIEKINVIKGNRTLFKLFDLKSILIFLS